jgi:tRNA(Met) cytidine acetyltransferase
LVAEPLSPTVFSDYERWWSYFYAQLAFQRQDWLASMDPELFQMISSDKADAGADGVWDISKADFEQALITGFAEHFRSYESTAFVLHRLLEQLSKNNPHFLTISTDDDESVKLYKGLLDLRVLQQETEAAVIKRLSLTGQKMLIKNLRQAAAWLAKLVF